MCKHLSSKNSRINDVIIDDDLGIYEERHSCYDENGSSKYCPIDEQENINKNVNKFDAVRTKKKNRTVYRDISLGDDSEASQTKTLNPNEFYRFNSQAISTSKNDDMLLNSSNL